MARVRDPAELGRHRLVTDRRGARRAQPVWPEDAGKPSHLTRGWMRAQPEGLLGISGDVQVKSGRIATDPSCDFP